MIEPKMDLSKYEKLLDCTPEEIKALIGYSRNDYKYINAILTNNDGLIEQAPDLKACFSRNSGGRITPEAYAMFIQSALEAIPRVYSAMLKDNIKRQSNKTRTSRVLYRGTSIAEADSLERGTLITKFISTTEDGAGWQKFAYGHRENASEIRIVIDEGSNVLTSTPEYMLDGDVLHGENEVLIGPFTRVVEKLRPASQSKNMASYIIKIEQAQLESLSKEEQEALEKQIAMGLQVDAAGHSKIYDAISILVNGKQDIDGEIDFVAYLKGKAERAIDPGDIEDYNAKIEKTEARIEKIKAEMEEAKLALREWKNAIIKLSMAKCYDTEHQLAEDMQRCEEKNAEQQKDTVQPATGHNVSPEENVPSTIIDAHTQKAINMSIGQLNAILNNFGQALSPTKNEQKEQVERLSKESRSIHQKITELNHGRNYEDSINTYLMLLNKTFENCKKINPQIKNSQNPEEVATMVERLADCFSSLGIRDFSQVQVAMQQSAAIDENLLKKLVFEKFCDVAIETEVPNASEKFPEKENYTGQQYSVRYIVAEMELFIEEQNKIREADGRLTQRSQKAIEDVKRLRDLLFSEFKVPNAEVQIARAKEAIRMQEAGKRDLHIARAERLYGKMERIGIPQSNKLLNVVNYRLAKMNDKLGEIGLENQEMKRDVYDRDN